MKIKMTTLSFYILCIKIIFDQIDNYNVLLKNLRNNN